MTSFAASRDGVRERGKDRRNELNAPEGAAFVKLAFFPEEGRCIATMDPDVDAGGLLADHGGNDSRDAIELNLDAVVRLLCDECFRWRRSRCHQVQ